MAKASPIWTAVTEDDRAFSAALAGCRMSPGHPDKRFARDLIDQLRPEGARISIRQRARLCGLVYRYRRQINDVKLVARSCIVLAGLNERLAITEPDRPPQAAAAPSKPVGNPLDALFVKAAS